MSGVAGNLRRSLQGRLAGDAALRPVMTMGASSVAVSAINLAVGAITARALGVDGRGDLLILTLYAISGSNLLLIGLDVVLPQLVSRHGMRRTNALAWTFAAAFAATAIALGVFLAADALADANALDVIGTHLGLFALFFAASHLSIVYQGVIVAEGRYGLYALLRTAMPVIVLAGAALAWAAGAGLWQVFLAYVAGSFVYVLSAGREMLAGEPYDRAYRADPALMRRYGGAAIGLHLARVLEVNCIAFVVTLFGDSAEGGLYAVAMVGASVVVLVSEALSRYAFGASLATKVQTAAEFRAWFARMRRMSVRLILLSVAAAGPLVWLLIPYVYGADFAPARVVVIPLMLAAMTGAIANVYAEIAKGQGLARIAIAPKLAAAAIVFATAVVPIPDLDLLTRLCIAFIAAQAVQLLLLHRALSRRFAEAA